MDELIRLASDPALQAALAVAALAGVVRGFAGFGAGLVFMPLASALSDPATAVVMLFVADTLPTLPIVIPAAKACRWRQVLPVALGFAVAVPAGVWLLANADTLALRWFMAAVVFALLVLLASGWRYGGEPKPPVGVGVGMVSGFFGGAAMLAGPPVLAYWLGGPDKAWRVRANVIVYFAITTVFSGVNLWLAGLLTEERLLRGVLMAPVYFLAIIAGQRLFRGADETLFRRVAFALIALAAVISLPLLDPLLR
jgi:uncharacterized membrane protein YfcA